MGILMYLLIGKTAPVRREISSVFSFTHLFIQQYWHLVHITWWARTLKYSSEPDRSSWPQAVVILEEEMQVREGNNWICRIGGFSARKIYKSQ